MTSSPKARRDDEPREFAGPPLDESHPLRGDDRASAFRQRYLDLRRSFRTPLLGASHEPTLTALLEIAVPQFADWCVIDVVDPAGGSQRLSRGGDEASLAQRVPVLPEVIATVLASGHTALWAHDHEEPCCVVVALQVKDAAFATVAFVLDRDRGGYRDLDVAVAEEAAWGVAALIERIVLHRDARDAVRGTQRLASQLHQLIAASITVAGLRQERDIVVSLAESARRAFDVELAVLSLENGASAPLLGVAQRGQRARAMAPEAVRDLDLPTGWRATASPWHEGDWLVAPVTERRESVRGVLALKRIGGLFQPEEREVLALLAQIAATSLNATELTRGVERSETRLRTVVETAPAGIVEVDTGGVPRWWNSAASRIFGWASYDDNLAQRPSFPAGAQKELSALWDEARAKGGTALRDLLDVQVRGRKRDLTTSAALLPPTEDEPDTVLMLVDDVTDHRQLRAEVQHAQQMELRGRVASSVAHDFNNLLTLISGYAEILARELQDQPRSLEMVKDIQSTSSRASMLTAQLQSIGRSKSLAPVVLDPVAILQSNAEVLERIVGHDVNLVWSLNAEAGRIKADAGQFEQMMLNLAINARDAMPDGGQLRIGVDRVEVEGERARALGLDGGTYILISVGDTGVGMSPETLEHCFDAFFTTKGPFKGTGMGLAAARRLVEESHGSITVTSQLGVGTTFEILFPSSREAVVEELATPVEARPRGSATILVADDDDDLRRLMVQVLTRNGYRVLAAETGEEALEVSEVYGDGVDLLVSDVVMSDLSGPELARTLQGAHPDLLVLLTSGTADATVLAGLRPGSAAFLPKPFRPSALIDLVHGLLAHR